MAFRNYIPNTSHPGQPFRAKGNALQHSLYGFHGAARFLNHEHVSVTNNFQALSHQAKTLAGAAGNLPPSEPPFQAEQLQHIQPKHHHDTSWQSQEPSFQLCDHFVEGSLACAVAFMQECQPAHCFFIESFMRQLHTNISASGSKYAGTVSLRRSADHRHTQPT